MNTFLINYAAEKSIVEYLSGSLTNPTSSLYQATCYFYTGISDDQQRLAPAVTINVEDAREVYLNTQTYEVTLNVIIAEMAADTTVLGTLAMNVLNEFYTKCGVNNPSKWDNDNYNFKAVQVQTIGSSHKVSGDALITTGTFRIICGLS